jgi:hypothetical protein
MFVVYNLAFNHGVLLQLDCKTKEVVKRPLNNLGVGAKGDSPG